MAHPYTESVDPIGPPVDYNVSEETVRTGGAEALTSYEEEYDKKLQRLQEVEREAQALREELTVKETEIQQLREILGLTPLAQFKQAVESSVAFQKTKELGDRVASSEAFKKTQTTLNDVGNKTGELLKSAGDKTSAAIGQASQRVQESETLNGLGVRFRQATDRIKSSFNREGSVDGSNPSATETETAEEAE